MATTNRRLLWVCISAALALAPLGSASAKSAAAAAPYVPGLGEIMGATQMRHLKLWYAGEAQNWPLAAYEVDELAEGFADAARYHPRHKDAPRPIAELIPEFTAGPISALRAAIAAHDARGFAAAYDGLTAGCNGCHEAARFDFNVVVRPTANPYSNQRFAPESPNSADATGR
ncbi:MAG TPA: hypothetical protein VL049_21125 [Candidatus Dormibacteraeota bacterium]|nr:hypothetical protein [Candidatus Dormibacteraeota bacterium]